MSFIYFLLMLIVINSNKFYSYQHFNYNRENEMSVTRRIMNGSRVTDHSLYPFMVALIKRNSIFCGGTLIDEFTILTAAHCIFNDEMTDAFTGLTFLAVGMLNRAEIVSHYHSESYVRNYSDLVYYISPLRKFKSELYDASPIHDVGIIKLKKPFDSRIKKVPLNFKKTEVTFKELSNGNTIWSAGYGYTDTVNNCFPTRDFMEYLNHIQWPNTFIRLHGHKKLFTYYLKQRKCTAHGDSGGPLLVKNASNQIEQWGIISNGKFHSPYSGTIGFADLNRNKDFIKGLMGDKHSYCGDIDHNSAAFRTKLSITKLLKNSRKSYPWLMVIVDQQWNIFCHVLLIGDNSLLILQKCLNTLTFSSSTIMRGMLYSEWEKNNANNYGRGIRIDLGSTVIGINSEFSVIKLSTRLTNGVEYNFYCRPICVPSSASIFDSKKYAITVARDPVTLNLITKELNIAFLNLFENVYCVEVLGNHLNPSKPYGLGSPMMHQSEENGQIFLMGMYLPDLSNKCMTKGSKKDLFAFVKIPNERVLEMAINQRSSH